MSETLLQLLVFEHATGDVTVQTETGVLKLKITSGKYNLVGGTVSTIYQVREVVREAIDAAVAEQYGRGWPDYPYIMTEPNQSGHTDYILRYIEGDAAGVLRLTESQYRALDQMAELPITDASGFQPVSTWKCVFPLQERFPLAEADTYDNLTVKGYNDCVRQTQRETAFTIWRLTVTR